MSMFLNHGEGARTGAEESWRRNAAHQLKLELAKMNADPYLINSKISAGFILSVSIYLALDAPICLKNSVDNVSSSEKIQTGEF
jgi:hypothetical protein